MAEMKEVFNLILRWSEQNKEALKSATRGIQGLGSKTKVAFSDVITQGDQMTRITNNFKKAGRGWKDAGTSISRSSRGFKMEWLSVLFFGMAIQRMFGAITSSAWEATGGFSLLQETLSLFAIPATQAITEASNDLAIKLSDISPILKDIIGWATVLGEGFGGAAMQLGILSLGIAGLKTSGILAGIVGVVGNPWVLGILAIVGTFLLLKKAIDDNWLGIRTLGEAISGFIKDKLEALRTKIIELLNLIPGVNIPVPGRASSSDVQKAFEDAGAAAEAASPSAFPMGHRGTSLIEINNTINTGTVKGEEDEGTFLTRIAERLREDLRSWIGL